MLTFALFPIVLFFLGAALVTGLPVALSLQSYYQNRGRQGYLLRTRASQLTSKLTMSLHSGPLCVAWSIRG